MAEHSLEAEKPIKDPVEELVPPSSPPPGHTGEDPISSPPVSQETGINESILIRDRYLIDPGTPLPELNQPSAKAYAAEDRRDLSRKIYALTCTPGMPIRIEMIKAIRGKHYRGILPLIDWEITTWPPLGQSTPVIIYERPLGGSIAQCIQHEGVRIPAYDICHKFAEPLIDGLQVMNELAGPHRAIRPENLYFLDENMEKVVLGPNVTAPPGFDQTPSFETIYRAMCLPEGRGLGDISDDIYALAVTFIHFILGYDPLANKNEEDLIFKRLENGSYVNICGDIQMPLELIEPLRNMMLDNPVERWGAKEITDWITEQITNPAKILPPKKAKAPFLFRNREHFSFSTLALHFAQQPQDAIRAFDNDNLHSWIKRYPNSSETLGSIIKLLQAAKIKTDSLRGSDAHVVSLISTLLDPDAPIHYKDLTFMPDGFGSVLAIYWSRRGVPQDPAHVLSQDILANWFKAQGTLTSKLAEQQEAFAKLKIMLSNNALGYGLERVVYELNPGFPCQSRMVVKANLIDIEHLLPAMEEAASSEDTTASPIDRDIAAFIATRFREAVQPHLKALASEKTDTSVIGMLSLLAFLQWKLEAPSMLALSSWVGGLLGPAISSYHNRQTRDELEKEIPKLVRKGSMPDLFSLIDDETKRQEDAEGFREAQEQWLEAEEEIRTIEGSSEERLIRAERSGQQTAATISIVLGLTVVSILLASNVF